MISLIIAGMASLALPQAAPDAAPVARAALDVQIPELAGTSADPTCGGKPAIAQQAFCVVTTMAAMQGQADQYDVAFKAQGWIAAGGSDNLTVYVRRKADGGCDAFQLLAFADDAQVPAPAARANFAFASIPGDVCTRKAPAA